MSRETRAMQDDDTANPGMLWVLDGETLWKKKAGSADKACADCHGDAATSMNGVAARLVPAGLSPSTRATLEAEAKAQPTPARLAGLVLGSPEFQRR